jgi:hypothetical protein
MARERVNVKQSYWRKTSKELNIHRRHLAINSNEQVLSRRAKSMILSVINTLSNVSNLSMMIKKMGLLILNLLFFLYFRININLQPEIYHHLPNWKRTINSFSESECWNFFETKKEDLPRLLRVWRIPNVVILENGSKMSGEELMLRGIYELVSGEDQYNICTNVFGRDQTQQSRAFKYFINHMYDHFQDLLTNNLHWWYRQGYLHQSMEAMKAKFGGNDLFSTCMFIDCNCLECCRPGGGPIFGGPDADRWDPMIQKAFYNGFIIIITIIIIIIIIIIIVIRMEKQLRFKTSDL